MLFLELHGEKNDNCSSMYDSDKYLKNLGAVVDIEKSNLRNVQRERNMALALDFASNLVSFISRGKGVRFPVSTEIAGKVNYKLVEAQERLSQAQRDYNGHRALIAFKNMMENCKTYCFKNRHVASPSVSDKQPTENNGLLHRPMVLKSGLQKRGKPRLLDISMLDMNKKEKHTI